jgi:hypothetical protein
MINQEKMDVLPLEALANVHDCPSEPYVLTRDASFLE